MVEHFGPLGVPVRFIEFMDVGATNQWSLDEVITSKKVRSKLAAHFGEVTPLDATAFGEVARRWRTPQGWEIGTIDSISAPFCGDCTRARLAADGSMHTCLFSTEGKPLMPLIKAGASRAEIQAAVRSIWTERSDAYSEERSKARNSRPSAWRCPTSVDDQETIAGSWTSNNSTLLARRATEAASRPRLRRGLQRKSRGSRLALPNTRITVVETDRCPNHTVDVVVRQVALVLKPLLALYSVKRTDAGSRAWSRLDSLTTWNPFSSPLTLVEA